MEGNMDLYEFYSGRSFDAYREMGAHVVREKRGKSGRSCVTGATFMTYAPHGGRVTVTGEFNGWGETDMDRCYDGSFFRCFVPGAKPGQMYKYKIYQADGAVVDHCDPYGFGMEKRPAFASIIRDMEAYSFHDEQWMKSRDERKGSPLNIYELHIGSWKCKEVKNENGQILSPEEVISEDLVDKGWYTYRELAPILVDYVKRQGYNYVEFMPLSEHPSDESWGYQNTGFFSPTSRYGTADDLKYLIDTLHKNKIGAIMDYVPVHFALDSYGLAKYDGTALYEYPSDDVGYSEWGSKNFIHSKGEVQSFLKSAANYWLTEYHFDGLRMDAISRIIFWMGDESRGVNDKAVDFIKQLNQGLKERHPTCILCAEDSTSYRGITKEVRYGGLGFDYKWDMGWMNDTLDFFRTLPFCRDQQYHKLSFSMMYYFNERYMLPLSHDEVVHGKATIIQKMAGDYEEKFPNVKALYGYMYAHPGKKLNFMGNEIAQFREWDEKRQQDWDLLKYPAHDAFNRFMRELNSVYLSEPSLSAWDDDPAGFNWILCGKEKDVVYIFERRVQDDVTVVVMNLSGNCYRNYHFRYGEGSSMRVIMNTDWNKYGGDTSDTMKHVYGERGDFALDLQPLSVIYMKPEN
jgi:1,4-alpha-glucan branching enzyme